jgi:hypothetical protein
MLAAAMAGGTFVFPRLTTSPTTFDQTGSAVVSFSPPIGTTTLTIASNAGGGDIGSGFIDKTGGGQGARATGLAVNCANNDVFVLTFTAESGRGQRVVLTQNGVTVVDLRGGFNGTGSAGGDGGESVTPSVAAGAGQTASVDPTLGASSAYLSGTVFSGDGGWTTANQSAAWIANRDALWPGFDGVTDLNPPNGEFGDIFRGPGAQSRDNSAAATRGYGGTQYEFTTTTPPSTTIITDPGDLARMVVTF